MALNRYAKLRRHKKHLKQRHANAYDRYNIHEDERREREDAEKYSLSSQDRRNGGYLYWRNFYLSGNRRYAKFCTNRRIRSKYRNLTSRNTKEEFLADVKAPKGADYEKEFDYFWTIW